MDFYDYQERARATAIYPREQAITYPLLGLFGEVGEVAEKVKKTIRDHGGNFNEDRRAAIAKELGDCLWYAANLCEDLGLSLNDVARKNLEKLADRQQRGTLQGEGDAR